MIIIIVNDGEYRWGADADVLFSYMRENGWTIDGDRVEEPDSDQEDPSMSPYAELCHAVLPVPDYTPDKACDEWDNLPQLTFFDGPGVAIVKTMTDNTKPSATQLRAAIDAYIARRSLSDAIPDVAAFVAGWCACRDAIAGGTDEFAV